MIILISNYIVASISLKQLDNLEKKGVSEEEANKKLANTGLILYGIAFVVDTIMVITILKTLK